MLEQHSDDMGMPVERGLVQRRVPLAVAHIRPGACAQQQLHHVGMSVEGCPPESSAGGGLALGGLVLGRCDLVPPPAVRARVTAAAFSTPYSAVFSTPYSAVLVLRAPTHSSGE